MDSQCEECLSPTSDSLTLFCDPMDSSLDLIFWPDPLWGLRLVDPRDDCWLALEPMMEMDWRFDPVEEKKGKN